jgi:hypothetical protein
MISYLISPYTSNAASLLTDCHITMIPCATVLLRDMSMAHG